MGDIIVRNVFNYIHGSIATWWHPLDPNDRVNKGFQCTNKGDTNNPKNYRGITFLISVGKLFANIINKRLNTFFMLLMCSRRIKLA